MIPHEAQCASPSANPGGGRSRFDPSAIPRNDRRASSPPWQCAAVPASALAATAPQTSSVTQQVDRRRPGVRRAERRRRPARRRHEGQAAPERPGRRSGRRAGRGAAGDLGREPHHRPALPLRRRAPALRGHAATTAPAPSRTRCTAATCSTRRWTPATSCAGATRGKGDWITVYTNPGHAYTVIAGLRLDTSAAGDPSGGKGPRWRPTLRSNRGFRARHLDGL